MRGRAVSFRSDTAQATKAHELARMVERMRAGDAEAVAWFIQHYGPLIQRRVRSRLAPSVRRVFDSQEILSTVSRRLLRFVTDGRLHAISEHQLWTLVLRMAQGAVIDKGRIIKRLRSAEGPDSPFAELVLARIEESERGGDQALDAAEIRIESLFNALKDPRDKELLALWLHGNQHADIAEHLGTTHAAVRQRWQGVKQTLRTHLTPADER
ncbi:MAG: sigma-70 family RNA polymerase sigma factor [Phycisphaeraceae bacterium]|nr:sigma-70 family RNA polymerase sigma factor [Phycisphaeraceae bacterium]